MQRIESNVQTGERKVIDLTPEEVADAQARTEAEAAKPVVDHSDLANVQEAIKAAVFAAALMAGKTPAQAKAAYKTARDSLNGG